MSALLFFPSSISSLDSTSPPLISAGAQASNIPIVSNLFSWQLYLMLVDLMPPVYAEKAEAEKSFDAMRFNCVQRTSLSFIESL